MIAYSFDRGRLRRPTPSRLGAVKTGWILLLGSLAFLAICFALLSRQPSQTGARANDKTPLMVYCAAGLRKPVEQIVHQYQQEYGVSVQLTYGGSQTLLANLKASQQGDLYIPADDSYVQLARDQHLADENIVAAHMTPVLCVRKGNPHGLHSLQDLIKKELNLGQANPEAAAIGRLVKEALTTSKQWDQVATKTRVFKGTVNDVMNDVKLGVLDATFGWDALLAQYPDLEAVHLPELDGTAANISIAVLKSTTQPTAALRFARYLTAKDRGLPAFEKNGYQVVEGDDWSETPELHLLSGAMLRPAVEQTIADFEAREGVRVSRVYNGCGILIAQMRAGERPDAYFSCERSFMTQVNDLFFDSENISRNQLVLLTAKDNPKGLRTVQDLAKPDLKIGVGHERQSALGALTKTLLENSGAYDAVRKNVTVESPTGDYLVNQIRTGSLDAVIVYRSNASAVQDKLAVIPLDGEQAIAIQPVAVGRESHYKELAKRLIEAVKSETSKDRFLSAGFHWEASNSQTPPAQAAQR